MGLFALHVFSQPSAQEYLSLSQTYFNQGKYSKALQELAGLDVRIAFDSSEDMINALKIRAISYAETNALEQAREAIRELLFIDATYKFDPFDTPKRVCELAETESRIILGKKSAIGSS